MTTPLSSVSALAKNSKSWRRPSIRSGSAARTEKRKPYTSKLAWNERAPGCSRGAGSYTASAPESSAEPRSAVISLAFLLVSRTISHAPEQRYRAELQSRARCAVRPDGALAAGEITIAELPQSETSNHNGCHHHHRSSAAAQEHRSQPDCRGRETGPVKQSNRRGVVEPPCQQPVMDVIAIGSQRPAGRRLESPDETA